jgi:hypothetical protein
MTTTRIARSARIVRSLASVAVVVGVTGGTATADDLADTLSLVPSDAVAWAVAPSLSRFNADLGDLIDRADRPELAVAGRPVDVLVSQFGVAAGFDERGSLAVWSPTAGDLLLGHGVVAVPVESGERFIEANFTADPDAGPNAGRLPDGTLIHHRVLESHVLLAPRPDLLGPPDLPDMADAFVSVDSVSSSFGADAVAAMRRADLVLRIDGAALAEAQRAARAAADEAAADAAAPTIPGGLNAAGLNPADLLTRLEQAAGGAADVAVAIDADALALGIRGWTRYAAGSPIAALAAEATPTRRPVLSALPEGPYYVAAGLDVTSFGGAAGLERLTTMLGDELVDAEVLAFTSTLDAVAFATRPSKLGVAMGGILNDASLVYVARNPAAVREAFGSAMSSLNGVEGAVARTVSITRDATQRRGGVADEITMTAEIAPESDRDAGSRVGDASIQLTAERLIFGPRGWIGLGRLVDGAYVVTFSRRPDVMQASADAADGITAIGAEGRGLAADPTLVAMREWLPTSPGLEVFIDVGRLAGLARQVASLLPGAGGVVPEIPEAMPPIGFGLSLERAGDDGRVAWGVIVPSEVIGAAVGAGMRQAMDAAAGGAAP